MPRPDLALSLAAALALCGCQTMTEMGKAIDDVGAELVRHLTVAAAPAPSRENVEVAQPLAPELADRRGGGRAALLVSDAALAGPAHELLRASEIPRRAIRWCCLSHLAQTRPRPCRRAEQSQCDALRICAAERAAATSGKSCDQVPAMIAGVNVGTSPAGTR